MRALEAARDHFERGIDELEAFEYSITDAGNVKTGAPGSYHDDCVMALALAAKHFQRPRNAPVDWETMRRAFRGQRQFRDRIRIRSLGHDDLGGAPPIPGEVDPTNVPFGMMIAPGSEEPRKPLIIRRLKPRLKRKR